MTAGQKLSSRVHEFVAALPRFKEYRRDEAPFLNGIYFFFEQGETIDPVSPALPIKGLHAATFWAGGDSAQKVAKVRVSSGGIVLTRIVIVPDVVQ